MGACNSCCETSDVSGDNTYTSIELEDAKNNDDINKTTDDRNMRYYSHIMQFTVKKGKNIVNKHFINKSHPYVQLEWGGQSYSTRYLNNTLNPIWNETAFLFVNKTYHSKYQLKLCVMDKAITNDDELCTGYIPAAQIFENCCADDENVFKLDVNMQPIPVRSDRSLLDLTDTKNKNNAHAYALTGTEFGKLEVEMVLRRKEKVEKGFYQAFVSTFDKNGDGVIDVDEFCEMFSLLNMSTKKDEIYELFHKYDENNDMTLDENEVIQILCDADFQGSELFIQLMSNYLSGDVKLEGHLMVGLTHNDTIEMYSIDSSNAIKIRDRESGLFIQEFIPNYIRFAQKLMTSSQLNRRIIDSDFAQKIISGLSAKRGRLMDSAQSVSEIKEYIKTYNIDTKILYKKLSDFKTFNDFFARGIRVNKYRALSSPNDENIIVSPADCRLMCWNSILDSSKFWIKGSKFTLENLCGPNSGINISKYSGGSFVIARLSIQDYHRWHYPVSGKVINIQKIDGKLFGANPILINSDIDAYVGNKRAIVEIECECVDNINIGNCLMFIQGSIMVGSYRLHKTECDTPEKNDPIPLKIGDNVKRGDVAGEFRFGGSTVLLLFEPNKIKFDDDIIRNVKNKFETLVKARSRIGIIYTQQKQTQKKKIKKEEAIEPKQLKYKPPDDIQIENI